MLAKILAKTKRNDFLPPTFGDNKKLLMYASGTINCSDPKLISSIWKMCKVERNLGTRVL